MIYDYSMIPELQKYIARDGTALSYRYYNAPTTRPNAGGWAKPFTSRIIGLSMLNNIGIHWFNGLTSIKFNMPMEFRNGTETLSYSFRLNTSYTPRDYKADVSEIKQPMELVW